MPNPTGDVTLAGDDEVLGQIQDYERYYSVQAQGRDGSWEDLTFGKGGLGAALPDRYRVAYEAMVTRKARFANRKSQGFDRLVDAQTSIAILSSVGFQAAMRVAQRTVVLVYDEVVVE